MWFAFFIYVAFDNRIMLYIGIPIAVVIIASFIIYVYKDIKLRRQYDKNSLYSIWLYDDRHERPDYGSYRVQFYIYHSKTHSDEDVLRFGDHLTTAYSKTNDHIHVFSDGKIGSEAGSSLYDDGRDYIPFVTMDMSLEECQSKIEWEKIHESVMGSYLKHRINESETR